MTDQWDLIRQCNDGIITLIVIKWSLILSRLSEAVVFIWVLHSQLNTEAEVASAKH